VITLPTTDNETNQEGPVTKRTLTTTHLVDYPNLL